MSAARKIHFRPAQRLLRHAQNGANPAELARGRLTAAQKEEASFVERPESLLREQDAAIRTSRTAEAEFVAERQEAERRRAAALCEMANAEQRAEAQAVFVETPWHAAMG